MAALSLVSLIGSALIVASMPVSFRCAARCAASATNSFGYALLEMETTRLATDRAEVFLRLMWLGLTYSSGGTGARYATVFVQCATAEVRSCEG